MDRRLIRSSRSMMALTINLNEAIRARREAATAVVGMTFRYTKDLVGQLVEVRAKLLMINVDLFYLCL